MNQATQEIDPPRRVVSAIYRGLEQHAVFEINEGPHKGEVVHASCGGDADGTDVASLTRDLISRADVIAKARELSTALSAHFFAVDTNASDPEVIETAAEVARVWSEAIDLTA
jgi:hypothetical protein